MQGVLRLRRDRAALRAVREEHGAQQQEEDSEEAPRLQPGWLIGGLAVNLFLA